MQNSKLILPAELRLSGNSIDEKRAALKDIFDAEMPARRLESPQEADASQVVVCDVRYAGDYVICIFHLYRFCHKDTLDRTVRSFGD